MSAKNSNHSTARSTSARQSVMGLPTSRASIEAYTEGIARALANAADALTPGGPLCIVVNDRRELYPAILERAGLRLEERYRRHVNRRTGRRSGEYYEDILVAR